MTFKKFTTLVPEEFRIGAAPLCESPGGHSPTGASHSGNGKTNSPHDRLYMKLMNSYLKHAIGTLAYL